MPFPSSTSATQSRLPPSPVPTSTPGAFRADWLAEAAKLNGKSLHTALALAWLAALNQVPGVRMTRRTLAQFSISREAYYDSIRRLEAKKLIRVWRLPGRAMHTILLEPGGEKPLDLTKAIHPR